jgi:hypothetical protein
MPPALLDYKPELLTASEGRIMPLITRPSYKIPKDPSEWRKLQADVLRVIGLIVSRVWSFRFYCY